jgi:hypothetical protein
MTFTTWTGAASRAVTESPIFNLELSFQLAPESSVAYGRRQLLVAEALKSIADRDPRLATWRVSPVLADGWVHTQAVIRADAPSDAIALSQKWMASAIAAANLAEDPAAARVPDQRSESFGGGDIQVLAGITPSASADHDSGQ